MKIKRKLSQRKHSPILGLNGGKPDTFTFLTNKKMTSGSWWVSWWRKKKTGQRVMINLELENVRDTFTDSVKDQVLIKTQNSLNNLIEDYGRLEGMIKSLNEKISELEKENKLLTESSTDLESESSKVEQLETEIYGLKRQLNDFERSKKLLEDNIHTLKSKQSSVIELEKALESLENRNKELKEEKKQ